MSPLQRFKWAQETPQAGFDAALREIEGGGKRGHWIWYVFPQLDGLGSSDAARTYAIHGVDEAREFLRDAELRARLLSMTHAVAEQLLGGKSLRALMGSDIDARKVVSSLTLFRHVARTLHASEHADAYDVLAHLADQVLVAAELEGYPPCAFTLQRLQ